MHRASAWLLSLAVGVAVGAAVAVLTAAALPLLAAIVVSYAAVVRLSVRHPDTVYEPGVPAWAVGRWSGLSIAFLLGVTLVGVGPALSPAERFPIQILVLGAGYAMWLLGIAYARAKATDRGGPADG